MFLLNKKSKKEKEDTMEKYLPFSIFQRKGKFDISFISEARIYDYMPITISKKETLKDFSERIKLIWNRIKERDFYNMSVKLCYCVIISDSITLRLYPNGKIEKFEPGMGLFFEA